MTIMMIPDRKVATIRPLVPYWAMMPYIMTTKAAVGPPICTRLPPRKEMKNPAIMAV